VADSDDQERRFNVGQSGVWPPGRDEFVGQPPETSMLARVVLIGIGVLIVAVVVMLGLLLR
jgi:hypothetical protein